MNSIIQGDAYSLASGGPIGHRGIIIILYIRITRDEVLVDEPVTSMI